MSALAAAHLAVSSATSVTPHLSYLESITVGLIQGVTELFPISSLGHNVLIPAMIGGQWATDLNVASPVYLAFIVGLHVATAAGITIYFWRDWGRILAGFFSSLRKMDVKTTEEKLAWMIIVATIPVGLVGVFAEHFFKTLFAVPSRAAIFLIANGVILFLGERFRTRGSRRADEDVAHDREREMALVGAGQVPGAHSSGQRAVRQREFHAAIRADRRLTAFSMAEALLIGSAQILALLAGISRDGVTMVAGMFRGLSREDAARFAFLLATPVILAAGVFKAGDLVGPIGRPILPEILAGCVVAGIAAYLSVRFLMKYFQTRTLTPFAVYCVLFGAISLVVISLR